jgi:predicted protein tyrosine phosphatase
VHHILFNDFRASKILRLAYLGVAVPRQIEGWHFRRSDFINELEAQRKILVDAVIGISRAKIAFAIALRSTLISQPPL